MEDFTINELKEIVTELKTAYKRAVQSGGVASYSLKSSQGETSVTQASISSIRSELAYFTGLLNERVQVESGAHVTIIRTLGL